jgi:hypothetical protein
MQHPIDQLNYVTEPIKSPKATAKERARRTSHWRELLWSSHWRRQSWCTNLMLPLQAHGYQSGWSSSPPLRQIRHTSLSSSSSGPAEGGRASTGSSPAAARSAISAMVSSGGSRSRSIDRPLGHADREARAGQEGFFFLF